MKTGKLTPRSNNLIKGARFTGAFGQTDGFGSILTVEIKTDGRAVFTCTFKEGYGIESDKERFWTVELDNSQRLILADMLACYNPTMFEFFKDETKGF